MSNGIGRVWAVNAEGGDEGRPNGVGPVYIENADQLGSKLPEPAAGDAGKVLGVLNSSGDIGWVEDQSGTLTQVQSDWNEDDSSQVSYIQNKPTLATVATSGSYADLSNKPSIPAAQVQSDWNQTNDQAVDFIKNKPTIPAGVVVDQSYSASSTNAQSGTAVADALSGINQVPSSTSADSTKVLTVNSSGVPVWAAAQGGGSSYTFSAPLRESSGTVVLDVDTDNLKVDVKTTTLSMQRSMSGAGNNGYGLYVGGLVTDTSGTVYTFTFDHVPVPSDVSVGVQAQGKKLYPLLVGQTYGDYGNQWIIPTALTLDYEGKVNGSFSVCFKPGEQDYPTSLTSGANLNLVAALVFVLSDMSGNVPSAQVNPSSIYGSSTSGSTVSYSTGGSMLMVKHPVPAVTSSDNGKVLKATYAGGVGSFGWDTAPTELPASLGTAGQVLTVNSGATGVEWATAQSGSNYTAGGGISISAQDEISVKAGNGITIGNYTYEHTGTINLTATPVLSQGTYSAPYVAQLTSDMLSQMASTDGLQFTLNGAYDGGGQQLYIALATNATTYSTNLSNRLVFDVYLGTSIAAGTTVTVKTYERVGSLSTKTYADVAADISSYYLIVFWGNEGWGMYGNVGTAAPSADPITTGTYTGTETVTVQNAVNLSVPIEVVAAMPASPTSGVLYIVTGS